MPTYGSGLDRAVLGAGKSHTPPAAPLAAAQARASAPFQAPHPPRPHAAVLLRKVVGLHCHASLRAVASPGQLGREFTAMHADLYPVIMVSLAAFIGAMSLLLAALERRPVRPILVEDVSEPDAPSRDAAT